MFSALGPEPESVRTPTRVVAERLYVARTVLIFGEITTALAESVSAQLLALASESSAPILVVINSPGGHVESADTIHDTIRFVEPEVNVLGTGWVASAGALIYSAAERCRRFAFVNTRFLLHEPRGGVQGQVSDIEIEVRQTLATRERLLGLLSEATGQTVEKLAQDTARNHWLSAQEAVDYGLVGRIVRRASELGVR